MLSHLDDLMMTIFYYGFFFFFFIFLLDSYLLQKEAEKDKGSIIDRESKVLQ